MATDFIVHERIVCSACNGHGVQIPTKPGASPLDCTHCDGIGVQLKEVSLVYALAQVSAAYLNSLNEINSTE